ncbi:hypothetical protein CSUI_007949 [Cystoisospora suis]|uniref:Uncharacterized protein n=1 Tax=Cystoisospora suis TaxID=483139 RepID=A0A2C6KNY5_9APIC|nr:hypothetical protein CSUI_007949 [Cystoisospora suis]
MGSGLYSETPPTHPTLRKAAPFIGEEEQQQILLLLNTPRTLRLLSFSLSSRIRRRGFPKRCSWSEKKEEKESLVSESRETHPLRERRRSFLLLVLFPAVSFREEEEKRKQESEKRKGEILVIFCPCSRERKRG